MNRPRLEPPGYVRRISLLPHQLTQDVTPTADAIVLCHLGIPRIDAASWQLEIGGMVSRPRSFSFDELRAYQRSSVETVHQCAGSPLAPFEPTRRVCNVRWTGTRLADILSDCGMQADAKFVWSAGADHGEFSGVKVEHFVKDLPLERLGEDVLIAYELNGELLPPEHGFPARLVVPGFYGTNSVKWLKRLEVAAERADSPFTTTWYNDPIIDEHGRDTGKTQPVWSVAPESVIVAPGPDQQVQRGVKIEIWGRAWADKGIDRVDVSSGDAHDWTTAKLERRKERGWQRFSMQWSPKGEGVAILRSRAYSTDGQVQPPTGRRNAIHSVTVQVL